jgi:hypothetical protein
VAAAVIVMTATAAPLAAQTITAPGIESARVGIKPGYGGRGLDFDLSVDSARLAAFRFRADVGHGHWVGINSNGNEPRVTRFAASALLFMAPRVHGRSRPEFPTYLGVGIGAYVPHGAGFAARTGVRVIAGMELSGEKWTAGPEFEADLTNRTLDQFVRKDLLPTFRIGFAIRRHF